MLETADGGVKKNFMTASRAKWMTTQRKRDGVRIGDGLEKITHDGVRYRSRQSENFIGGEMTASDFSS